jgi:NAD(P)-dependent dehydrogenase (short-subunit alcohol dehydrogenase family)
MPEALIWGASGGIGSALVSTLKGHGWRVFAAARDETRIPAEADQTYQFEASAPQTISGIPPLIAPESDGLDLVVYAAGALRSRLLDRMPPDEGRLVLESNFTGAWLAAQSSIPLMKENSLMVFMGAYIDHLILPKMGLYAAAKAALDPLVAVLAKENRKLRFSIVRPGPVDTPFWEQAPFKLPKDAKPPSIVAEAIYAHWLSGQGGDLNL